MRTKNVLFRAVKKEENSFTELLVNLMQRKYLRTIILSTMGLCEHEIRKISYADIQTQKKNDRIGIPDIVIRNSDVLIFIEVKIDPKRAFEESQLNDYPKEIFESRKKYAVSKVIYLVPELHFEMGKIRAVKEAFGDQFVKIATWEKLLHIAESEEVTKDSRLNEEVFRFFTENIISRDAMFELNKQEVVIMSSGKDLLNSVSLLEKTMQLLESNQKRLSLLLDTVTSRTWKSGGDQKDSNGWGLYFDTIETHIFVGFNRIVDEFIFSVAIPSSVVDQNSIAHTTLRDEEYLYFPFDKYLLVENESDAVNNIEDSITSILKKHLSKNILAG